MIIYPLLILYTVKAELTQCLQLLDGIALASQYDPLLILLGSLPYIPYSGLGIQEFGLYDQCLRQNYTYSTMGLKDLNIYRTLYIGICHSTICSADDLNNEQSIEIIKWLLDYSGFTNIIGINMDTTDVTFIDPKQEYPPMVFGTYFTIISIIIIVLLCLYYPTIHLIYYFKQRKTRYQQLYNINQSKLILESQYQNQYKNNNIFEDFNLIPNFNTLTSMNNPDPNLVIFNGFRSIAFLMVVYGHTYETAMSLTYPLEPQLKINNKSWLIMWIFNMLYSVDVFFWIGGFFLGFITCDIKKIQQIAKKPFSILFLITHRLCRILPCYFISMLIINYLIPYTGSGPRWATQYDSMVWNYFPWKQLLFIDNFFKEQQFFFAWGWYLTTDFQLFLSSLIPISFYAQGFKKLTKFLIIFIIIITSIIGLIISINNEYLLPYTALIQPNQQYKYYIQPWCRAPPYYFGLLLGILYRELKYDISQERESTLTKIKDYAIKHRVSTQIVFYFLGWTIILFLLLTWRVAYIHEQIGSNIHYWPKWFQEIYHTFCRLLFVIGCSCFLFINMVGIQDFFNTTIMNCAFFRFLAKISFTCYLLHILVMIVPNGTFYQTPSFTERYINSLYIGVVAMTIVFGFLLSLTIELPFGKLETRLMKCILKQQKKQDPLLDK